MRKSFGSLRASAGSPAWEGAFMGTLQKTNFTPRKQPEYDWPSLEEGTMIQFVVNGKEAYSEQPADTPLLWVIREELGLTGTKFGCGIAQCGACTVHVNGNPARACVTP